MAGKDKEEIKTETPDTPDYADQIAEIKKQNEELQKKLGEQSAQMGQFQEYVTGTSTILAAIAKDETLTKSVRAAIKGGNEVPTQQQEEVTTTTTPSSIPAKSNEESLKVEGIVKSERQRQIREFEQRYGIDKLPKEQGDAVRKQIGEYVGSWGYRIDDIPTEALSAQLDRAYVATHAERLKEEGKLEGIAAARTNMVGAMGSMPSGAPDTEGQVKDLSPKQKEWLKKLGVKDEEGAKKTYLDRENEKDREPEEKK